MEKALRGNEVYGVGVQMHPSCWLLPLNNSLISANVLKAPVSMASFLFDPCPVSAAARSFILCYRCIFNVIIQITTIIEYSRLH